jgi:hypothetical protein
MIICEFICNNYEWLKKRNWRCFKLKAGKIDANDCSGLVRAFTGQDNPYGSD